MSIGLTLVILSLIGGVLGVALWRRARPAKRGWVHQHKGDYWNRVVFGDPRERELKKLEAIWQIPARDPRKGRAINQRKEKS